MKLNKTRYLLVLLVSCLVANVGIESDAVLDRQGVATRYSVVRSLPENPTIARVALAPDASAIRSRSVSPAGSLGEETQRGRSGYGAARMPRLLRDRALVLYRPLTGEAQQSRQPQLASIMSQLRENWQDMEGLSAKFTHTFEWVLAGETQVTEGDIYLAGRNRFRIEFDGRAMVSDGTTLWDYDPKQNQVLLYKVDASRNITTQEQLFAAYTENVNAEWVREELRGETRIVVIRLLRGEEADPQRVEVWIDTGRMLATRAEYTDGAGNDHTYLLEDIEIGEQPAEKFKFDIPEGVIVVDLRPGSGR